jgi:hypothetical protein
MKRAGRSAVTLGVMLVVGVGALGGRAIACSSVDA